MLALLLALTLPLQDTKATGKEALKSFQELIGSWNGTGTPETGTAAEKTKGFWKEKIDWSWKFKGDDAWLAVTFDKSKHFKTGELRYDAKEKVYRLNLTTSKGTKTEYVGVLINQGRKLIAEDKDEKREQDSRLTLSLVGEVRFQYGLETKPKDRKLYQRMFQVGATREGESFAGQAKSSQPECVVSGGLGTTKVTHNGETYYVCCSGCLDAFKDNPEKYIAEFKAKKK